MTASSIRSLLIFLSLSTAAGVLIHDTRLDKATVTAMALPVALAGLDSSYGKLGDLSGTPHTHTERASLSQLVHDLRGQMPRIMPRENNKKHVLPRYVARGHHAFDNYNLPIV